MTAPPPDDQSAGHKLFVGGLPSDCEQEELEFVFSTYGVVERIHIMPPKSKWGLRCAFVIYSEFESAEDAIKVLDGQYKIREEAEGPIQVRWPRPRDGWEGADLGKGEKGGDWGKGEKGGDWGKGGKGDWAKGGKGKGDWNKGEWGKGDRGKGDKGKGGKDDGGKGGKGGGKDPGKDPEGPKLFVGTLPSDCSEEELQIVFSTYGEVKHIHLMQPHNMTGMRCAFITYDKYESAEDAIQVLNDIYKIRENAEHPILVRWANDRKGGAKGGKDKFQEKGWGKGKDRDGGKAARPALGGGWNDAKGGWPKGGSGSDEWGGWQDRSWRDGWEDRWQDGGKGWGGGKGSDHWWDEPRDWGKGGKKGGKGDAKGKKGDAKGGKADGKDGKGGKGGKDFQGGKGGDDWGDAKGGKADHKGGKGGKDWPGGKGGDDWGNRDGGKGGKGGGKAQKGKQDAASGRLRVSNLPEDIIESDLEYVFSTYGRVDKIDIVPTVVNGSISAFIDYAVTEEAETAILALNGNYEIREGYGPLVVKHASTGKG